MPQSHHASGPRMGCSRAVLNKNHTSTHGAHTGPVWCRTNFASPYGTHRVLMFALYAYGPCTGFEILNILWTAHAGTARAHTGPVRPNTTPVRDFCRSWLCQFPYMSMRAPYGTLAGHTGPRTDPVGYEKHWRFPCGACTVPVRASHGVPMEYCELFNQTIGMQKCQDVWVA